MKKKIAPLTPYNPELGVWRNPYDEKGRAIRIFEDIGNDIGGRLIATVEVAHSFSEQDAIAIATLMAHAPALWRALRERARWSEGDVEGTDCLARLTSLLWNAAGRNPFDIRDISADDRGIRLRMEKAGFRVATSHE